MQGVPPKWIHTSPAASSILKMKSVLMNSAFIIIQRVCVCTFFCDTLYSILGVRTIVVTRTKNPASAQIFHSSGQENEDKSIKDSAR